MGLRECFRPQFLGQGVRGRSHVEWKTKRGGRVQDAFDAHDTDWLITFTFEHPETFGYLVNSYSAGNSRNFTWLAVKRGEALIPERRS